MTEKAKAFIKFGAQAMREARFQDAERAFRDAADTTRDAKDMRLHARAMARWMDAMAYQGRLEEARQPIVDAAQAAEAGMRQGGDQVADLVMKSCLLGFAPPGDVDLVSGLVGSFADLAELHARDPDVARACAKVALIAARTGDLKRAAQLLERAVPVMQAGLGPDHPDVALMLFNLADVKASLVGIENLPDFEPLCRRVLAMQEAGLAPLHPERVTPLMTLGARLARSGRYEEADSMLQRALKIALEVEGPDGATVDMVHSGLHILDQQLGDATAEPFLLKKLAAVEADVAAEPHAVPLQLAKLCQHYVWRGKPETALAHYRRLWTILEKLEEEQQLPVRAQLNVTLKVYRLMQQDRAREAESFLLAQLELLERVFPAGHLEIQGHVYFTGNFYRMCERHKDALAMFERYADTERRVAAQDPGRADGLTRMLDAQLELGDRKAAERSSAEIERLTGRKPVMNPGLNEIARQLQAVWHMLALETHPDLVGAALKGDPGACLVVGLYYAAGAGVRHDADQARSWLEASAKSGSDAAVKVLEAVREGSDLDYLAIITQAAVTWAGGTAKQNSV